MCSRETSPNGTKTRETAHVFGCHPRLAKPLARIDSLPVDTHFKVEVWTRRAPCRTHLRDDLASLYLVAGLHRKPRVVRVTGLDAAPMVDLDQKAVTARPVGVADRSGGHGSHRRAVGSGDVDPLVHPAAAKPKFGRHRALDRPKIKAAPQALGAPGRQCLDGSAARGRDDEGLTNENAV